MLRICLALVVALSTAVAADTEVAVQQSDDHISVTIGGTDFSTFYFGAETTKPYLHPIHAADGTIVTRGYPMEDIDGEQRDHPHHRGQWFSHGEVNDYDFWANELDQTPRDKKGKIVLDRIISAAPTKNGKAARIVAQFYWQAPDGTKLLRERRTMIFREAKAMRSIDFDITLTAVSDKVHFGDTKEGTFAIRLATALEENHRRAEGIERTGVIRAANGDTTESNVWGTPQPWVDYSGKLDGKAVGVAILDHPANPKHPTHWHVRAYGLFAANIFGEHHFYNDDTRDGSITLSKGQDLRFRYRLLVHPGDTQTARIAKRYARWAKLKQK